MEQFDDQRTISGIKELHEYEYFSVVALWYIAEFIERMETTFDLSQMKKVECSARTLSPFENSLVARCMTDAMAG